MGEKEKKREKRREEGSKMNCCDGQISGRGQKKREKKEGGKGEGGEGERLASRPLWAVGAHHDKSQAGLRLSRRTVYK